MRVESGHGGDIVTQGERDRVVAGEVIVNVGVPRAWDAWTTEDGVRSFFAPACNIEPRVGGPYEILFDPDAEPGSRGAEGMTVMAVQPMKMLAFSWNAPPHLSEVRDQLTHVVVRFEEVDEERTRVTLRHDGWGDGGQWDDAFAYFERAWFDAVLPRFARAMDGHPHVWEE
jgi:uncharacterized protein YndB with AHSA1/START domain